jgi:hypothetical protein
LLVQLVEQWQNVEDPKYAHAGVTQSDKYAFVQYLHRLIFGALIKSNFLACTDLDNNIAKASKFMTPTTVYIHTHAWLSSAAAELTYQRTLMLQLDISFSRRHG